MAGLPGEKGNRVSAAPAVAGMGSAGQEGPQEPGGCPNTLIPSKNPSARSFWAAPKQGGEAEMT